MLRAILFLTSNDDIDIILQHKSLNINYEWKQPFIVMNDVILLVSTKKIN